jgi:hypothetical protein
LLFFALAILRVFPAALPIPSEFPKSLSQYWDLSYLVVGLA